MTEPEGLLPLYLHLARASELRRRLWARDKMLVLAGVTAVELNLDKIAAFCRHKILSNNPGHLVGHYTTLGDALTADRFLGYLKQLRRNYPHEKAEHMLDSLGIEMGREREVYYDLQEYAAALLGTTPDELKALFGT